MPDDDNTAELFDLCNTLPANERTMLLRILRADPRLRRCVIKIAEGWGPWVEDLVASGQPWITPSRPV